MYRLLMSTYNTTTTVLPAAWIGAADAVMKNDRRHSSSTAIHHSPPDKHRVAKYTSTGCDLYTKMKIQYIIDIVTKSSLCTTAVNSILYMFKCKS